MIIDYIKELIIGIIIVLLLLGVCVSVDYADTEINNHNESSFNKTAFKGVIVSNNSTIVHINNTSSRIVAKSNDEIHTVKQKHPTITMTGKPSCGCGRHSSYTWRTRTYVNYCPNCHHHGCLGNKHKWQARFEKEITCFRCDSDFCINCGHEKYSWSKKYLRKA